MTGPRGVQGPDRVGDVVRRGLEEARRELLPGDPSAVPLEGKLLRPAFAYAAAGGDPGREFWLGALAVQMVHEASLLHDDIVDGASTRRGRATEAARKGVARALVAGDRLLTSAYRAALETGSPSFARIFVHAVEETVAGEMAQGREAGRTIPEARYLEILELKSGALFGAAMALAPALRGQDPAPLMNLGRRVGRLYQLVDDVLDYCPGSRRGKPPFQDYRQGKWTLPMGALGPDGELGLPVQEIHRRLFDSTGGPSVMTGVAHRLKAELQEIVADYRKLVPGDGILPGALGSWEVRLDQAVRAEEDAAGHRVALSRETAHLSDARGWQATFGTHARTFSFAARLFPGETRREVAGVYAFCRFSDDLVDGANDRPSLLRARLRAWEALAREAYGKGDTGIPLLDRVLGTAARRGVPFRVVEALLEGISWDVEPRRYADMGELSEYTYRVAGTVGEWFTHLAGCSDGAILERARSLGHAMQLTNILRDVGEDYRMGRIYLPRDRMAAHGIGPYDLEAMVEGRRPPLPGYRNLVEELLQEAEEAYDHAMGGVPALPAGLGETVAVAARSYRGIHREIRRNGYDNLTRRAYTSLPRKLVLAGAGLLELRRLRSRNRRRASQVLACETPSHLLTGLSRGRVPA